MTDRTDGNTVTGMCMCYVCHAQGHPLELPTISAVTDMPICQLCLHAETPHEGPTTKVA